MYSHSPSPEACSGGPPPPSHASLTYMSMHTCHDNSARRVERSAKLNKQASLDMTTLVKNVSVVEFHTTTTTTTMATTNYVS